MSNEIEGKPAICIFCGDEELVQIHDVWSAREFMLDTCCPTLHDQVIHFLNEDPKQAGKWLGELGLDELGLGSVRRLFDNNCQLQIDWNLEVRRVQRDTARGFVAAHHEHCPPPPGWRFGAGLMNGGELIGVVMVGRPVARMLDPNRVVEVNRLCINREIAPELVWNGCSKLYGWAAREARKRGYAKIITYTLESEDGTSLRAAGWIPERMTAGGSWNRAGRSRLDKTSIERKVRWAPAWCAQPERSASAATP